MSKKYIIIIEAIVWLILIIGILLFFSYKTILKDNSPNSYYLFINDAGGIVKGSPVKLMGMNIGYVRDVKIFDNKVFVSFLVKKKGITIPNNAEVSIEFYGLGGSTSLEINPETSSPEGSEALINKGTARIQDYWDGSVLTANVMIDTYDSVRVSIDKSGILNHKDVLKQSKLVSDYAKLTGKFNDEQTVIIHKLTESTKDYLKAKNQSIINEPIEESENE